MKPKLLSAHSPPLPTHVAVAIDASLQQERSSRVRSARGLAYLLGPDGEQAFEDTEVSDREQVSRVFDSIDPTQGVRGVSARSDEEYEEYEASEVHEEPEGEAVHALTTDSDLDRPNFPFSQRAMLTAGIGLAVAALLGGALTLSSNSGSSQDPLIDSAIGATIDAEPNPEPMAASLATSISIDASVALDTQQDADDEVAESEANEPEKLLRPVVMVVSRAMRPVRSMAAVMAASTQTTMEQASPATMVATPRSGVAIGEEDY